MGLVSGKKQIMEVKTETTFWASIFLAGDISVIKQVCRQYCKEVGLCVTVKDCLFIYTGGEEFGVEIGLINYPRFPGTPEAILSTAETLAGKCRDAAYQHSYLILTPEKTIWNSTRDVT